MQKRSTHTVYLATMGGGGPLPLGCKKVIPHTVGYAVCSSCWCKRSTHTVYVANMGGGDRYIWCKKIIPPAVGYTVCSSCRCKKVNTPHSGHAVHAGVCAKKSNQCMQYAVCSGIVVYGGVDIVFGAKRSNRWMQCAVDTVE